jgi:hypothetical protein
LFSFPRVVKKKPISLCFTASCGRGAMMDQKDPDVSDLDQRMLAIAATIWTTPNKALGRVFEAYEGKGASGISAIVTDPEMFGATKKKVSARVRQECLALVIARRVLGDELSGRYRAARAAEGVTAGERPGRAAAPSHAPSPSRGPAYRPTRRSPGIA